MKIRSCFISFYKHSGCLQKTISYKYTPLQNKLFHSSSSFTMNIEDQAIVTVAQGKLKGIQAQLVDGSTYYSFRGIPYAAPPVGDLRFKAPQPPKPWTGVLDATQHGSTSPQYDFTTGQKLDGSEDCLFLNIYTKSFNNNIPVMVYIHGGGFMSGSGNQEVYGPDFLLQHDVVLVTFNYRLEVLGYLCLDIPEVPGNAGMKDQVAALRWVKENIKNFGGDPNNVTIFGESAGSASVSYHLVSPMSTGLFHKAIMQSGTFFNYWTKVRNPFEWAERAAAFFGKNTKDPKEILKILQNVPAEDLAKLTLKVRTKEERAEGLPLYFVPTIEKQFTDQEAFISEDPIKLLLEGKINDVPVVIGYNDGEGQISAKIVLQYVDEFNKNFHKRLPRDVQHHISENNKLLKDIGNRMKEFYANGKDLSKDDEQIMSDIETDAMFSVGTHYFAYFYSKISKSQIYMYKFSYVTEMNFLKNLLDVQHLRGPCHADDLFYIFNNIMTEDIYKENEDIKNKVYTVTKMWTDFAKTGNPTPSKDLGIIWVLYTAKFKEFMHIDHKLSIGQFMDKKRVEFWDKIYAEAGLPCMNKSSL